MAILSHELLINAETQELMLFLHGFLGSKANWRSIARKMFAENPKIGPVLIDIRMHGESQNFESPHSLARAADDIIELCQSFLLPVRRVLGHSFGAKLALGFVERFREKIAHAWIIDAPYWQQSSSQAAVAYKVLDIFEKLLHHSFLSRQAFEQTLIEQKIDHKTAQWLAMNLVFEGDAYRISLQPSALRALLDDYFQSDFSHSVLHAKERSTHIHFVIGENSDVIGVSERARIEHVANTHASHVHAHVIQKAGHYVHVDAPLKLLDVLLSADNKKNE